jgi:putative flavoprotein involved in K+ transport
MHASEYRRPDQLPPGAVLVVGSGQSGCQIAHELNADGRRVYLSLGRCPWVPLRYRTRQFARWAIDLGLMEDTVDSLPRHARLLCNPVVGDADGGHLCDPERLARDGVILIGRVAGLDGAIARVIPDAGERLAEAATFAEGFRRRVDALIDARALELPQALARERAPTVAHDVRELDLTTAGVAAIVWANGYRPDFGWLGMPAFDRAGWPLQTRGVTAVPGLYFVGLPWLHKRKSALFLGVGEDAEHVVSTIVGDSPAARSRT